MFRHFLSSGTNEILNNIFETLLCIRRKKFNKSNMCKIMVTFPATFSQKNQLYKNEYLLLFFVLYDNKHQKKKFDDITL